jgi:hypothetical protein
MPLRIGLFQFELSHPNNAPHMGSCLIAPDLIADGHQVDACLVGAAHVPDLLERIDERGYDLIALDSIFPIDVVNQIKDAFPHLPLVVGGVNALALFLSSAADLAIVGPGRWAMRSLAGALASDASKAAVPNLFFRVGVHQAGVRGELSRHEERSMGALAAGAVARSIDHSGHTRRWDVAEETLPYGPLLDWDYLGTGRDPGAGRRLLSVVPEFGCPYMEDALVLPEFGAVEAGDSPGRLLDHLRLSPRAETAMQPFMENTRGCSFCVFRFQDFTIMDVERTVDIVLTQIRHLHRVTGALDFSLQTENPFRILRSLVTRLRAEGPALERLAIRTFAAVLLAKADEFRRALDVARQSGLQIVLQQVGFENFDQRHLDIFNKGISVEDNLRAARLLGELKQDYGDTIEPFTGHGLILFDPWTTIEDLDRNVRAIERDAPFLLPAVGINSKLVFYDPFNPIFRKARNEGLVVPWPRDYGWDFKFADSRTADFVQMVLALERRLQRRLAASGNQAATLSSRGYRTLETLLFRRALESYLAHDGDPAGQREGFVALSRWIDQEVESGRT